MNQHPTSPTTGRSTTWPSSRIGAVSKLKAGTMSEPKSTYLPTQRQQGSSGTRYIFLTWSVDGEPVSGNPIAVKMDSAHVVTALRTIQYELTVSSDRGETRRQWLVRRRFERRAISVKSSSGVIVRRVFAGWSGDSSAKTKNTTVVMDGPKTMEASWRTDYSRA